MSTEPTHDTPAARLVPDDDPFGGIRVQRATPGLAFSDLRPQRGSTDESGLDILFELRGDR